MQRAMSRARPLIAIAIIVAVGYILGLAGSSNTVTIQAVDPDGNPLSGVTFEVSVGDNSPYAFDRWEVDGAPAGGNPLSVTLNRDKTAKAFYIDETPPVVTLTAPGVDDVFNGTTIHTVTVAGTVFEAGSGPGTLTVTCGNAGGSVSATPALGGSPPNYSFSTTLDLDALDDGKFACSASLQDADGNPGSDRVDPYKDVEAPVTTIDSAPDDPTNRTTATFAFSGTDNRTSPGNLTFACKLDAGAWEVCTSPQTYTGLSEGAHTVSIRATDEAGNTESTATHAWFVDLTEPQSQIESGPDDPTNRAQATFAFGGSDNHSAPGDLNFACKLDGPSASFDWTGCSSPKQVGPLSLDGHYTFSVRATDEAGNTESTAAWDWLYDGTSPVITGNRAPAANAYGWNNTSVTVSFSCEDPLSNGVSSGVDTFSGPTTLSAEGANQSVMGICSDLAGNSAGTNVEDIHIDTTPPSITGERAPQANANGWNNTDVTVHFDCVDALSEVASLTPDATLGTEGMNQSASGTCADHAGNGASVIVGGIHIDKTAPTVAIDTPPDGGIFDFNDSVIVDWAADDNFGIDAVDGTLADGAQFVADAAGDHDFVVTAVDLAGNVTTVSHTYRVRFGEGGLEVGPVPPAGGGGALNGGPVGEVAINEVAWSGTAASAEDEWIELYNNTDRELDLTGWRLAWTDVAVELGGTLPPGGFYLLERGDDRTVSDIAADLIYEGELADDGDILTLTDAAGRVVDTANRPELEGVLPQTWAAGSAAASMERERPSRADQPFNWRTHNGALQNGLDATGGPIQGTPRAENSVRQIPTFTVGEPIAIRFRLLDVHGRAVNSARPTLTATQVFMESEGERHVSMLISHAFRFDPETSEYALDFDTSVLEPGIYDLWIAFGDGTNDRVRVVLQRE